MHVIYSKKLIINMFVVFWSSVIYNNERFEVICDEL